jgi:uncharacterized protein YndB with AHSA1/START domain
MPATPRETDAVEHEVRIAARPETVFSYFTDPMRMVQWIGVQATLDPRPGGVCRIAFDTTPEHVDALSAAFGAGAAASGAAVASGRFVELDPPRRIVLTWGWEHEVLAVPPESTRVEVSLTPDGDDTIVRLAHRQLPPGSIGFHRLGWEHYMARLAIAAAGEDPGPDPWQISADEPR